MAGHGIIAVLLKTYVKRGSERDDSDNYLYRNKRALALNEFALGIESLERFVRNEPLYRTHECVFGVLALESEPVDLRL